MDHPARAGGGEHGQTQDHQVMFEIEDKGGGQITAQQNDAPRRPHALCESRKLPRVQGSSANWEVLLVMMERVADMGRNVGIRRLHSASMESSEVACAIVSSCT